MAQHYPTPALARRIAEFGTTAELSIEVGHCYADELHEIDQRLEAAWRALPRDLGASVRLGVLVDDYNATLPQPLSRDDAANYVHDVAANLGLQLDYVRFEADGCIAAPYLLNRANGRIELERDRQRLQRDTAGERSSIVLAEGERFCCPTLAACWALARLGVDPFPEAYTAGFGPILGRRALTVLSARYLRVEATVLDLIEAAGYRKQARRIGYVFTQRA